MAEEGAEDTGPKAVPPLNAEELATRREVHAKIFAGCDFNAAAKAAVDERNAAAPAGEGEAEAPPPPNPRLTYGELDFDCMAGILNTLKGELGPLYEGGTFLDLGSGSGRVLFAASLCHPFAKVVGIEVSAALNELAKARVAGCSAEGAEGLPAGAAVPEIVAGDCFAEMANVADPSVVFCNATCFSEDDVKQIADTAAKTYGPQVTLVTTTRMVPDTETWCVVGLSTVSAPYGDTSVFFHRKIVVPGQEEAAAGGG